MIKASFLARPALGLALLVATSACSSNQTANEADAANAMAANDMTMNNMAVNGMASMSKTAPLIDAKGATIGEATLTETAGGTMLAISGRGLPPGEHGFHVHMTGKCETPKFESAGGHWNPASKKHGHENPQGAHAGDLPNLTVAANGTVKFETELAGMRLIGGEQPLFDNDGAAVVIHADPDDEKTDPSGNSGARIACAAFPAS